ncbi:penicillin-binding protein 2 [Adlercreutzia faecimuris]|uniref:Penicillin-binding protein 2 n=1 Tax=Adlercreutzia faecimuris TaxID=2897341 RepID=A0ABS9WH54_9ACTN|nr:penicillin-binding protein 2 [Adlercreutzia sp. JBNU-10]MCI2242202.1 penicillin-binding protein 2 [Adlercreutzia sp. JBNU-10]
MLAAIIAAIAAGLVVVAVIVAVAIVRSRRASAAAPRKDVQQLDTVGVGTSPLDGAPSGAGDVHVTRGQTAVKKPADGLRSRFVALGLLATAVFGSLGAKLWSLQVLSSSDYSRDAEKNLYSTVSTPAPRGLICDAQGTPLVKNRSSQTVLADAEVADDRDVVRRLAAVLGVPAGVVRQRIQDASGGAQSQRVVADDVRLRDVAFISEHSDAFPGVAVETRTVREYPFGALAAHVLGYTGPPSEDELKAKLEGREIKATDTVGKSGVEAFYDGLISGDHGQRRVLADAAGRAVEVVSETQATKGSDVHLTIDARVQYVADKTLADLVAPDGVIGRGRGVAAAAVVMDVRDGAVLALSSFPTFDPANFTGGIPQEIWDLYTSEDSHEPLSNRVISGQYPAASTYKAFTSLAGLEYGFASPTSGWVCEGKWDGFGSGDVQMCWNHSGHGGLDLRGGIVHSCDVVFYEIAKAFFDHGPAGTGQVSETALQDYLARFNLDKATGIDLANEAAGTIPTPAWKAERWRNVPSEAPWRGGDYTNMIIGQGYVLVTPLEIAAAYGGVATGRIMRPHLLKDVRNAAGDVVVTFEPEVVTEVDANASHLAYVRDALRGVIVENEKVARMFAEAGVQAAGKSGTGENSGAADHAWFVAYAPYDDPKYVVTVIIDQGGGGSEVAAPVAAKLLGAAMAADAGADLEAPQRVAGFTGKSVEYHGTSAGRTD